MTLPRKKVLLRVLPAFAIFAGACAVPQGGTQDKPQSLFGSVSSAQTDSENANLEKMREQKKTQQVKRELERSLPLQKVDANVWRTSLPAGVAFQTLTRILSQSYVLGQVDRKQMAIATEWDKFLIEGKMFRNRVSAGVFAISARSAEIVIRNSVEYYDGEKSMNLREANWVPTADVTDEVQRIVSTLARQGAAYARR